MNVKDSIGRRQFIKTAAGAGLILILGDRSLRVFAQDVPDSLVVASHRVHRDVATTGPGGDITQAFVDATGIGRVEWLTAGTDPLQDLLFREASLSQSTIDVGFLLNTHIFPRITGLFDPLDGYHQADPIEDVADIFPEMMSSLRIGGELYGVPVRQTTSGLHYNQDFFEERGLSNPPRTIEEFFDYARRLTYTRADGSKVHGFVINGVRVVAQIVDIARAWNGDFITTDLNVVCNEAPMVKAITLLREAFVDEVLPVSLPVMDNADTDQWMQTGRAAMCVSGMGNGQRYNDPEASQFAGRIATTNIPISEELAGKFEVAPAKVEFWSMVIPRTARNKELSWRFIKYLSAPESTLAMALNGNGPVRESTYDQPAFSSLSYAEEEKRVLRIARVPLPAFDKSTQASDAINEEVHAALLGAKEPQKAMDDLAVRLARMLRDA